MATLDVLTPEEGRRAVGLGALDSSKDDLLALAITAMSERLDEGCGPVVVRSVTSETVTAYGTRIELSQGPLTAVSSITENGTALTASDWYAEPYRPDPQLLSGVIVRRIADRPTGWACGLGQIQVGYLAGRFASTTQVSAKYKQAAQIMLKNWWRTFENSVGLTDEYDTPQQAFPTFAVPKAVEQLLAKEWQSPVGFGA